MSFQVFRYTKMAGPHSNRFPAFTWEFYSEKGSDVLFFRFARCNGVEAPDGDNFSKKRGRDEAAKKEWYEIEYDRSKPLVVNAIMHLVASKDHYEQEAGLEAAALIATNRIMESGVLLGE